MAGNATLTLTIKALDKATAPLREVNARISRLTKPLTKVANAAKAFSSELGLPRVMNSLGAIGPAVGNVTREVGSLVAKLGAAALAAGFLFYRFVRSSVDAGDALAKTADRVGLTVDAFAQLQFVAGRAGISQDEFTTSMDFFNKTLGQAKAGTGSLYSLLKVVSPKLLEQARHAKSNGDAFDLMTHAIAKLSDPSKRAALAAAAFGRAGMKMTALVQHGVGEIAELRKEYVRIAGSQERFARQSEELNDAMGDVGEAFNGLKVAAFTQLFPVFTDLTKRAKEFLIANRDGIAKWARDAAGAITAWVQGGGIQRLVAGFKDLAEKVGRVVDAIGGPKGVAIAFAAIKLAPLVSALTGLAGTFWQVAAAITPVAVRLGTLAFGGLVTDFIALVPAITSASEAFTALDLVLAANPIGAVALAVGLLITAGTMLYKQWDNIKYLVKELWTEIRWQFIQGWQAIKPYVEKFEKIFLKFSGIQGMIDGFKQLKALFSGGDSSGSAPASRPMLGAGNVAAPGAAGGKISSQTNVHVKFDNVPKGTRVEAKSDGASIDTSLGYSSVGGG